jgi:hypothetical protein
MSYLFSRNSVLSDFCAKSFIVTKPIYPLYQIIEITLFAILFHLFLLYCLFLACRSSRRKRAAREFSRHRLRRPRATASGIQRQVSLIHIVPIFLYLSMGMHASIFLSEVLGILVSYLSLYYPCCWDLVE